MCAVTYILSASVAYLKCVSPPSSCMNSVSTDSTIYTKLFKEYNILIHVESYKNSTK